MCESILIKYLHFILLLLMDILLLIMCLIAHIHKLKLLEFLPFDELLVLGTQIESDETDMREHKRSFTVVILLLEKRGCIHS